MLGVVMGVLVAAPIAASDAGFTGSMVYLGIIVLAFLPMGLIVKVGQRGARTQSMFSTRCMPNLQEERQALFGSVEGYMHVETDNLGVDAQDGRVPLDNNAAVPGPKSTAELTASFFPPVVEPTASAVAYASPSLDGEASVHNTAAPVSSGNTSPFSATPSSQRGFLRPLNMDIDSQVRCWR